MVVETSHAFDEHDSHFKFLFPQSLRGRQAKHPEICWHRGGLAKGPLLVSVVKGKSRGGVY
jgi:hypothetical protein